MSRPPFPSLNFDLNALLHDEKGRHNVLVKLLGFYLFWARNEALRRTRRLCESDTMRSQLGSLFRRPYQEISNLATHQQDAAFDFAQVCVDEFFKEILFLLGNEGYDIKISEDHSIRFRLELEVYDNVGASICLEEVVNRGGKFLPDYWGEWINSFSKV